jgi:hypothetical protein
MNIAILTLQGLRKLIHWFPLACPTSEVTSMGGLTIKAQGMIAEANTACFTSLLTIRASLKLQLDMKIIALH